MGGTAGDVPALQIHGLRKSFGDTEVLHSIDLDVEKGEFLTLLGPSGSGKTTLLRIIAGFESATGGELVLGGTDISLLRPSERMLGMVFQNYALFPHMTVGENIAYGLKMRGYTKSAIQARVKQMIETVGLEQHAGKKPAQLSGGQQQRVALARALAYEPQILLMDEPLGALDRSLRLQMEKEIKRVHRDTGTTVIYVTHDQEEALVLSDRVAIMHEGVFAGLDTPMSLFTRPENKFVATFFSDANVFEGRVSEGVLTIFDQGVVVDTEYTGTVDVSVRPSNIQVEPSSAGSSTERSDRTGVRLSGRILERDLLGESEQFLIEIYDGSAVTARRTIGSGHVHSSGERVTIHIDSSGLNLMKP